MSDRVPVPPDRGFVMDGCIDPSLLTLHMDVQSVSTPDHVDFDDCGTVEDGGSAPSPSNSLSTLSDFSSYAGSGAGSPSDVGFSPVGMEPDSPAVAQDPTGLNAAPGNTMHNITAAQHGVLQETLGTWNMAMSANELAALQDEYVKMCNQAYDFSTTMHSIPNPPAIMMQSNGNPSYET